MPTFRVSVKIVAKDLIDAESSIYKVLARSSIPTFMMEKGSRIMAPRPRQKWFVYKNGVLDLNSLGGLTKTKAKRWIKDYKRLRGNQGIVFTMKPVP